MFGAFFSYGFRPFFLAVPLIAILAIILWVPHLKGSPILELPAQASLWHAHEMIFGLVSAAIAGFILTAITNWTNCPPLRGAPLAGLFILWLAGRAGLLFMDHLPFVLVITLSVSFFLLLAVYVGHKLIQAGNKRNFMFIGLFLLLASMEAFLIWSMRDASGIDSQQLLATSLGIILLMIALVGGRITPAFTRNWLQRQGRTATIPVATRFDIISLLLLAVLLVIEQFPIDELALGTIAFIAALAHSIRLARWHSHRTLGDPLMWSLHLGYAWIPIALWLKAAGYLFSDAPETAWLHAAGIGAAGTMIIAVMSRATLGHTGRPLVAPIGMALSYLSVSLAAVARVLADFDVPISYEMLIQVTGILWLFAFALFLWHYGPMLIRPSRATSD